MAIKLSFSNILTLISTLSPTLISFFFLISSILNQNLKGLVYLLGVIVSSVLNIFLLQNTSSFHWSKALAKSETQKPVSCGLLSLPYIVPQTSVPCTNSIFHSFTLSYLISMMANNNEYNYPLIIFLLLIFGTDIVSRISYKCTNSMGILAGIIIGILYGVCWFFLWSGEKVKHLLYYDELTSNNAKCSKLKTKLICKKKNKNSTSA